MQFPSESQARQGRRSAPIPGVLGLPRTPHRAGMQPGTATIFATRDTSSALLLLLPPMKEHELAEIDGLVAGLASAAPAAQRRLEQADGPGKAQAGRRAGGHRRSSVRKACAQVTRAQW